MSNGQPDRKKPYQLDVQPHLDLLGNVLDGANKLGEKREGMQKKYHDLVTSAIAAGNEVYHPSIFEMAYNGLGGPWFAEKIGNLGERIRARRREKKGLVTKEDAEASAAKAIDDYKKGLEAEKANAPEPAPTPVPAPAPNPFYGGIPGMPYGMMPLGVPFGLPQKIDINVHTDPGAAKRRFTGPYRKTKGYHRGGYGMQQRTDDGSDSAPSGSGGSSLKDLIYEIAETMRTKQGASKDQYHRALSAAQGLP